MQPLFTNPHQYRAYGFNLVSDIPLIRLHSGADPSLDTLTVQHCESMPEIPDNAEQIGPFVWSAPGFLSLNIENIVHMIARDGKTLLYRPYNGIDDTSVQLFLMGSGLGALLMQRKFLVMHGNAIEIDGACIMCVGPSGVGKSTTAAGLMQRGYRVLSDDICAIDRQNRIIPGMPHIKLWQEAADELDVETVNLERVRPELEKFGVPLGDTFCDDALPVKSIYLLSEHHSPDITCNELNAKEKFMALRNNTYRLPFVTGLGLGAEHFQQIVSLSNQAIVKHLKRPSKGFKLDLLLDTILQDAQSQKATTR